MIQVRSVLKVTDNSGAKEVRVANILGRPGARRGRIGDIIVGSVRKRIPNAEIEKGAVVRGVIVRTRNRLRRDDGSYVRFDDNAVVLINTALEPIGTRIFGPVPRELRRKNMLRILSLAPEVL
ncbi:50S ribosomal protein L14 [Candidatus Acetothermia bacterium]|jgi:large subunit ribosomal protein L14|nr:50S ribosomal protein L14 [Candidatus Acetothermia bacterium]MBI3642877.1 50S ribosomal protein L14 [Candidatus Acetothermia bacterium]